MKSPCNVEEIISALERQSETLIGYIHRGTGKVFLFKPGEKEIFEDNLSKEDFIFGDSFKEMPLLIRLPAFQKVQMEEIVKEFCDSIDHPKIQVLLKNSLDDNHLGVFKKNIRALNLEKEWNRFLHDHLQDIAIDFCKENRLSYTL